MDWGIVSTIKAPLEQVLAFVAHHKALGAAKIWLHFDDPEDPAVEPLSQISGVRAIRCTPAYWQKLGGRKEDHRARQSRNARRVYQKCRLTWLAHLDVDEFLHAARPIGQILGAAPAQDMMVRAEPFEAMHSPDLPDDIFTARQFRGPLQGLDPELRAQILGAYAPLLPQGMLSHANGKAFFRTGIADLHPQLHGAFLNGQRVAGPRFAKDLKVLHFHAQDRAFWLERLPFRMERGAYIWRPELVAHLAQSDAQGLAAFYDETQMLTPGKAKMLRSIDRLVECDLGLRDKVQALLTGG